MIAIRRVKSIIQSTSSLSFTSPAFTSPMGRSILAIASLFLAAFLVLGARAYVVPNDFVSDPRIRDALTKAYLDYNSELDFHSRLMARTSGPLSLSNATATAPGGAVYQRVLSLFTKYCTANVIQQDRIWDNTSDNPFAATFPVGIARAQGLQQIAGLLTTWLVQNQYHGQDQYFGPLRISQLGENTYRVWSSVYTIIHKKNALAPKGLLRVAYYGEKVHEYVRIPAVANNNGNSAGQAGDQYFITKIDNGMRHDFISAPTRINLPAPYDLIPFFNDNSVEQASVLCEPVADWEINN